MGRLDVHVRLFFTLSLNLELGAETWDKEGRGRNHVGESVNAEIINFSDDSKEGGDRRYIILLFLRIAFIYLKNVFSVILT